MARSISPYVSTAVNHFTKYYDPVVTPNSALIEEMDRYKKQLPEKTQPNAAILGSIVDLPRPIDEELTTVDKPRAAIMAAWTDGLSAIVIDRGWGKMQSFTMKNLEIDARMRRMRVKGVEVPAIQIAYPDFRGAALLIGLRFSNVKHYKPVMAEKVMERLFKTINGTFETA